MVIRFVPWSGANIVKSLCEGARNLYVSPLNRSRYIMTLHILVPVEAVGGTTYQLQWVYGLQPMQSHAYFARSTLA
jgi:hypothetical protein